MTDIIKEIPLHILLHLTNQLYQLAITGIDEVSHYHTPSL